MKKRTRPPALILASTSPRRIELMRQVGLFFKKAAPEIAEIRKSGEAPHSLVSRLASEKAWAATLNHPKHISANEMNLIIAADTIVIAPDEHTVLGKPKNKGDAFRMLKKLNGKTHTVLTAYCLLPFPDGTPHVRVVSSHVKMRALSDDAIRSYIKTGEPMDKAGAYAAQGVGMALIERINGSYTNVVGLPMAQLLTDLEERFGISIWKYPRKSSEKIERK